MQQKINNLEKEIDKLKNILKYFPNAMIDIDRWGNEKYYSKEINEIADCVDFSHSCGCCSDAPLLAIPYYVLHLPNMDITLHTNPISFTIANSVEYSGYDPNNCWEKQFKDVGISDEIINKIQKFFDDNPPIWEEPEYE